MVVIVHNPEDAEVYLRLGFAVTMPMRVLRKLSFPTKEGLIVHAKNVWNSSPMAMMEVWLERKNAK